MIVKRGTNRRTVETRVNEAEAAELRADGFQPVHKPVWRTKNEWLVTLNADERTQLRFARGVFGEPCAVHIEPSEIARELRLLAGRVERAATGQPKVDALLDTPYWRGSSVQRTNDKYGKPVFVLRHPSGARATVYAESES